ncbi:MAG: hypothetical protein ABID54_13945, partial [Pseudomonadota bacterium]
YGGGPAVPGVAKAAFLGLEPLSIMALATVVSSIVNSFRADPVIPRTAQDKFYEELVDKYTSVGKLRAFNQKLASMISGRPTSDFYLGRNRDDMADIFKGAGIDIGEAHKNKESYGEPSNIEKYQKSYASYLESGTIPSKTANVYPLREKVKPSAGMDITRREPEEKTKTPVTPSQAAGVTQNPFVSEPSAGILDTEGNRIVAHGGGFYNSKDFPGGFPWEKTTETEEEKRRASSGVLSRRGVK